MHILAVVGAPQNLCDFIFISIARAQCIYTKTADRRGKQKVVGNSASKNSLFASRDGELCDPFYNIF